MKFRKSLRLVGATILAIILSSCNLGATAVPTIDSGAIQTQAFDAILTQAAIQQTQTAVANPPTQSPSDTPLPTATLILAPTFAIVGGAGTPFAFNTQQPGLTPLASLAPNPGVIATFTTKNGCNDGAFMGETPPLDKTEFPAGKHFAKGWQIFNTGTCTWDEGYSFFYIADQSSPELNGYSIKLPKNAPNQYTKPGHSQTFIVKLIAPAKAGEYKGFWKLRDDAGNFFGPLVSVWIIVK